MAFGAFCNRSSRFYSVVLSAFGAFCIRGSPFKPLSTLLLFVGFEAVAPCKGNGISAQGIVNGVNDTLGPPPRLGFITFAPCRGNMSKMGQRPSTHTGAYRAPCRGNMSKMGQRPSTHTGAYRLNASGAYRLNALGAYGANALGAYWANASGATHLYIYVLFHQRIPTPDLRPCVVEGRCPIFDILPLQGAIPFKPCTWGTQGGAVLRPALPWAEIPLPSAKSGCTSA